MRFLEKWMMDQDTFRCLSCWDKDGYHPERSDIPEDAQLVAATQYSHSTIVCDGFETFFECSVGDYAPEVASTLERIGFSEAANALREAMVVVGGSNYPRTSDERCITTLTVKERLEELLGIFDLAIDSKVFNDRCEALLLAALDLRDET